MRTNWLSLPFALAIATTAAAYSVTYDFSGQITEYAGNTAGFNPVPGTTFYGQFTYDATYRNVPGPSPSPAALLDWYITVDGQTYHETVVGPYVQNVNVINNHTINFFDEQPGGGAQFFDQGGINLTFTTPFGTTVPDTLPLPDFISGYFSFSGPTWEKMRGEITSLSVSVPEPSSLLLLSLGLAGIALGNRKIERIKACG